MNGTAAGTGGHDMAGMGGHDMGPVDTGGATRVPAGARGGRPLKAVESGGEKVFRLTASALRRTIAPRVEVGALA